MIRIAAPALAALLALAPAVAAQPAEGTWSAEFDRPGLRGRVFATGVWNDLLIAGGLSLASDGADLTHLAAFDGELWQPLGGGILGDVRDVATWQGDLVVAGWFSAAGDTDPQGPGYVAAPGVARWDGSAWSSIGGGLELSWAVEPQVWALAVYQGELVAGGLFDSAGGQPIATIARWDGVQWRPLGGGLAGFEAKVLDMTVTADDRLVVAGEFESAGGQPVKNVAVWDGSGWSPLGPGLGNDFSSVFAVREYQGKLYATGNFQNAGPVQARKVAAWNGSGWEPLGSGLPDWDISVTGYALQEFGGDLYVGGNFIQAGGVASRAVARWDGSAWSGVGGVDGSDLATTAIAMTVWSDRLVVGGEFLVAGTTFVPGEAICSESIVAFDGVGAWSPLGEGLGMDNGVGKLIEWNGELYALGAFNTAGALYAPDIARFTGDGWEPMVMGIDGNIEDAVVFEGDLVITGNFSTIDGVNLGGTARLDADTLTWSSMQGGGGAALEVYAGQLYGGGLGSPRRWNGSSWETFGEPLFGQTYDMHAHDGVLYIGGYLGVFGGLGPHLVAWDGSTMETVAGGADDAVHAMTSWQGELIVGGRFDTIGGVLARRLARWDGSSFQPFGDGNVFTGYSVDAMTVFQDELYLGGDLVNFQSPYDWCAKWNDADGLVALGEDQLNAPVRTFVADEAAGVLWVGGGWFEIGDAPSGGITTWTPAGGPGPFLDLGGGLAGTAGMPALDGTGTLEAGTPMSLDASGARASAPAFLVLGFGVLSAPFKGGTLVPTPDVVLGGLLTGPAGGLALGGTWPAGVPGGSVLAAQLWIDDPAAPAGLAATNGLQLTSP